MATNREIFRKTLYSSELYQVYKDIDNHPREAMKLLGMSFDTLQMARIFAKRVFDVDPSQWPRTVLNQLRTKALRRSTQYPNIRAFGYDIDDYEPYLARVVGNHAYIGAPTSDMFIRLYVVDDIHILSDDRDVHKLEKYLEGVV